MLAAKADHALIEQVIIAYEAQQTDALEQRRKADAERQARKRSRDITVRHSDRVLTGAGDARVEDKNSNLEIEPQEKKEQKETRKRELSLFEVWYQHYPHKVQRGAAERAFPQALELAGSVEALIAGTQRYVASKPADRPYQNPATWLNGKGWMDEPATVSQPRAGPHGRPPTAQEMLKSQRESFTDDTPGNRPYLAIVG